MQLFLEFLKAVVIGIVQGITEWLPISSTGHMILIDELLRFDASDAFMELFTVVIQLGSILAVVILYFSRLNPFSRKKTSAERKDTFSLWGKILLACIPAGVVGVLLDDIFDKYFYNYLVVAAALIVYGILFIVIERKRKGVSPKYESCDEITPKTAFGIGAFQILALIPGTSRSGSTILGASLLGVSRTAAAEFSFFLACPIMLGASALKLLKYVVRTGLAFSASETVILLTGIITAFAVSLVVLKFLVSFVRKHSFEVFGWYRIALGLCIFLFFALKSVL